MPASLTSRGHSTGLHPAILDRRFLRGLAYAQLPDRVAAVDLSKEYGLSKMPDFLYQDGIGCCVGATYAEADQALSGDPFPKLSMRAIWERGKARLGWHGNTGITMEAGAEAALNGAPSEADFPLHDDQPDADLSVPDGLTSYDGIQGHRLIVDDVVAGAAAALSLNHPVAVAVVMDEDAWYAAENQSGVITERGSASNFAHAILVVYRTPNFVICQNHWDDWLPRTTMFPREVRNIATPKHVVFTNDAFRACVAEARELTPEAVKPRPMPGEDVLAILEKWYPPFAAENITEIARATTHFDQSAWWKLRTLPGGDESREAYQFLPVSVKG